MKVLMLGWELPPNNSGGLGVACYQMCKALSQKDIDIEFVVPYTGHPGNDFMTVTAATAQDVKQVTVSGIAYDSYKFVDNQGRVKWLNIFDQHSIYEEAVAGLVEAKEFDIVHAHDWLTFRAGMRVKELTGKPLIVHVHSVESDRAGGKHGNPMVHEIEEMGLLMADRIIAVSNHTKKAIVRDYSIPSDKVHVVHNSIDREYFEAIDTHNSYAYLEQMKQQGYKVVVNVGRLTIQKGLPNMLQAAAKTVLHHPKTLFLIVGAGEQYVELIDQAAQLGIAKNVVFTGFLRGKQWRDAYAIGDLFVMPSVSEPFGLTPLEAAGYGTPSLISKQSGVSEVFKNCLKVDYWDVDEMANQMTAVLQSGGLQQTLGRLAEEEFYNLSWHKAADSLHNHYQEHVEALV